MTIMSPIRGGILNLPTSQESRYSQSLERGLAILRAFSPERPWLGIAEIADTLEMSRPTTHRYASTLVALDYLEQGPRRKYRLGIRAGDPGRSAISSTALRKLPDQCLADLRDRSACTASLAVLDGNDIVYVDRARSVWQGESEVSERLGCGSRVPAGGAAMGRVLLAHRTPRQQREAIDAGIEHPSSSEAIDAGQKLLDELERIREKDFVIADHVRVSGQRCVAAPIRGRSGEVLGAVDVAAPKLAYSRAQALEALAPLVVESAREMSMHLGYTP
jgi:IclR family pca regulon transcriptional regulator